MWCTRSSRRDLERHTVVGKRRIGEGFPWSSGQWVKRNRKWGMEVWFAVGKNKM